MRALLVFHWTCEVLAGDLLGLGHDGLAGRQFGGADGVVRGLLGLLQFADRQ